MKVTLQEKPVKTKYPYLGIFTRDNVIVFFTEPDVGVCVYAGANPRNFVGEYKTTWNMSVFEPYNGTVTLENS